MRILADRLTKKIPLPNGESLSILQDISLEIESGEILGILGVSGSGKSTLLGILAGLDVPTSGTVLWDTVNLNQLDEDGRAEQRLHKAGFVFQSFELLPAYTAYENVLLPLELLENNKRPNNKETEKETEKEMSIEEKAKTSLEEVGLGHRIHHYPNQLSGGEQQRVAIARAFALEPKVLFADEPTGNLDEKTGNQVINLLINLNKKHKTTLICVTHDSALSKICQKVYHLSEGKFRDF